MNTIKQIKFIVLAMIGLMTLNSCVQDDDFGLPPVVCNETWTATMSITELMTMAENSDEILYFNTDQIIEGYVISSDSTGNFFKTISVQDSPSNPGRALQVEMDRTNLFNNFPLGSKVKVNLNGLQVGFDRGALKIGEVYQDANGNTRVGRMSENKIDGHVAISCDPISTLQPVVYSSISDAIAAVGASDRINTLVTIQNVQFEETGVTYADAANQTTVNLYLEGATEETNNQRVVLRNSGFADFAGEVVPSGSGSITAVLSAYDANNNGSITVSEYQLFIRDTNDVQFDNPRFGDSGGGDQEAFACLNEDFSTYNIDVESFPNYENLPIQGTRKWRVKEFSANKYIEISAYQATGAIVSYFVVPVNFDEADKFSFKSKDGHNNGDPLKVYYSTNYTIGGNISTANLVNITSSFNIATGTTNGYAENFTESGEYNFPSLSGEGVIVFAYEGGNGVTTTIQIDDIKIIDNEDPNCSSTGGGGDDPNPPAGDATPLFAGHDFENWANFTGGLNTFGLKPYATQSTGTGMNGSNSLSIQTTPTTTNGNDYVFTTLAQAGLPTTYSRITFYMKGSSDKSVSLNVYKGNGEYHVFNLGDLTSSSIIEPAGNNQYSGVINTSGEWVLVELDLSTINDLNTAVGANTFALKIGKNANYNLHFDNFTIE